MSDPVQKVERPEHPTDHEFVWRADCLMCSQCGYECNLFEEIEILKRATEIGLQQSREIVDLRSKLAAAENRALDAEHLLNGLRTADANDAGNDEAFRAIVAETGGRVGESVKGEAVRLIAELRAKLVLVYEGRCVDRFRMDVVTVQLSHETWRTIQSLWYQSKRDAN
jgi:hypothetical protein